MLRSRVFRVAAAAVVAVLAVGVSVGSSAVAAPTGVVSTSGLLAELPVLAVASEGQARSLAAGQGVPVEVLSERSETDRVWILPDGQTRREMSVEPVRVQRGGRWVDVDTTLVGNRDGSLSPVAVPVGLTFSGGGSGPLVSVVEDGVSWSFSWPGVLPTPEVTGASAVYRDVFPDVDLVMTATGSSFTQHLLVKTPAAAALPQVRSLRLDTTVSGGTQVAGSSGTLQVLDAAGEPVFETAPALAWDSRGGSERVSGPVARTSKGSVEHVAQVANAGAGPDDGDRVAPVGVSLAADGDVVVTPSAALLDGPGTTFPVVVDPTTTTFGPTSWAMVDAAFPGVSYVKYTDADQGVGYQDGAYNNGAWSRKRLFYAFNLANIPAEAVIDQSATSTYISTREVYSYTCAAGTVDAYLTSNYADANPASTNFSPTWNNQPAVASGILASNSVKAGRSDCNPGGVNQQWPVGSSIQTRLNQNFDTATFMLRGRDENSNGSWMRLAGPSNSSTQVRPTLMVTYNRPPAAPWALSAPTTAQACSGSSLVVNPVGGVFRAYGSDWDGINGVRDSVRVRFDLYQLTGFDASGNPVYARKQSTLTAPQVSPAAFSAPMASSAMVDGWFYWTATVFDADAPSAEYLKYPPSAQWATSSPWCRLRFDLTPPAAPSVSSTEVVDGLRTTSSATIPFAFSDTSSDVVSYRWSWVNQASTSGSSSGSSASVSVAESRQLLDTLEVVAIDEAGNVSTPTRLAVKRVVAGRLAWYPMRADVAGQEGWNRMNESALSAAPLAHPDGTDISGSPVWGPGVQSRGLVSTVAVPSSAVSGTFLDTSQSFSLGLSFMVDPVAASSTRTLLAQRNAAGQVLYEVVYDGSGASPVVVFRSRAANGTYTSVASPAVAAGRWFSVLVVYEAGPTPGAHLVVYDEAVARTTVGSRVALPAMVASNGGSLLFGWGSPVAGTGRLVGTIDAVSIWPQARADSTLDFAVQESR